MGSFKATVSINGGKPHKLIFTRTSFARKTGPQGKPSTVTTGGEVVCRIDAEAGTEVLEAMLVSQHKPMGLEIVYYQMEDEAEMRKTIGELGYVVEYSEQLDTTDDQQASVYFKCRFQTLTVGGATLVNPWVLNS